MRDTQQAQYMSKKTIIALVVAIFIVSSLALLNRQQLPPATGALTLNPEGKALVPSPEPEPTFEIGEKSKLFMNNNAYLFGSMSNTPDQAALSAEQSYRVGVGKEIESASGSKLMGEVSFATSETESDSDDNDAVQARLAAAYLKQLNGNSDFRAGLSTDLAPELTWSTLELQLSLELEDGLYLMFNQDYGHSMSGDEYEYQTGIAVEKKF